MNLSWEWKLFLLNSLCQSLFFIYSCLCLIIGLNTTLPSVYKDDSYVLFNRKLLAVYIFANLVGNYFCIKYKSRFSLFSHQTKSPVLYNNANNAHLSDKEPHLSNGNGHRNISNLGNWIDCRHCDTLAPPRSKHCGLCRACILKRDHHCFFAGCCIGFHNQRHFVIFCLYGSVGAFYTTFATSAYLQHKYSGLQEWGVVAYFIPVLLWYWFVGSTTRSTVLMVLFLYWSFFTFSMCVYFFVLQVYLIITGQTKFECKKKNFQYGSSVWNNIKSVFGPSALSLISFFIPSPCIGHFGNGKTWEELELGYKFA